MDREVTIRRIKIAARGGIRELVTPGPRVIWFTLGRIGYLLEKIDEQLLCEEYVSVIQHLLHGDEKGALRSMQELHIIATALWERIKESEAKKSTTGPAG